MKHLITIHDDGIITTLGNPLGLPGVIKSTRWSTIKPVGPLLRLLFNTVRYLFGDNGRAAEWTRRWPCWWSMTVLSTGYTARSNDRAALVELEHELYYLSKGLDL